MAMSVVYSNAFGGVIAENRGGVVSEYVPDTLGSTIGLLNSTGTTLTDRWEYWPYGEVLSRTGTNVTPFTFLGTLGYFKDILDKLFYVRARRFRVDLARWLTVDPLWPGEPAYTYGRAAPTRFTDPSGLSECFEQCMIWAAVGCGLGCSLACGGPENFVCFTVCGGVCLSGINHECHCICKDEECKLRPRPRSTCVDDCNHSNICGGYGLDKDFCCENYCKQRGLS